MNILKIYFMLASKLFAKPYFCNLHHQLLTDEEESPGISIKYNVFFFFFASRCSLVLTFYGHRFSKFEIVIVEFFFSFIKFRVVFTFKKFHTVVDLKFHTAPVYMTGYFFQLFRRQFPRKSRKLCRFHVSFVWKRCL